MAQRLENIEGSDWDDTDFTGNSVKIGLQKQTEAFPGNVQS